MSPKIAHPEQASTIFPPGLRSSSLGERDHCRHIRLGEYIPRQSSSRRNLSSRVREILRRVKSGH